MKKTGIIILTAAICTQALACLASAESEPIKISVTVANAGNVVVASEEVAVADRDGDGKYTLDEALVAVHDQFYDGGAAAGYASKMSDWGLSIQTLWGVTNGGSYGYTVNDKFANGLGDTLNAGDYFYAFVYQDAAGYSDHYSYFNIHALPDAKQGDTVALKLTETAFDAATGSMTDKPVANAAITVDGKETEYKTDENGSVSVKLDNAGDQIISAKADHLLIPAVVRVNAAASAAPETTAAPVTTAAPDTTAAETTSTTTAAATTSTTKATTGKTTAGKTAGAKTGDSNAVPALAVTAVLACGTALALRRRTDK